MPNNLDTPETYLKHHKRFRANIGDNVFVFRSAVDNENGWYNSWSSDMDNTVGRTLKIIWDAGKYGFGMDNGFRYPYFVLKIVR